MTIISWTEVWDAQRQLEEEVWREHYTSLGFESWAAWRKMYADKFRLEHRSWALERVGDPTREIPLWWVGAYRGWRPYYPEGTKRARFEDIAQSNDLRSNNGVAYARDHVPSLTRLIVFRCGEDVVVRDGTHRSAAIALRAEDGESYPAEVEIAVTDFARSERSLFERSFDQRYARTFGKGVRSFVKMIRSKFR